MTLKKVAHSAIAALLATAVLTGCTSITSSSSEKPTAAIQGTSPLERAAIPEGTAKLGDAVMAFFVGPQSDEMQTAPGERFNQPGYLVLVNADGSFRTIKTKPMDMMRLTWSNHGLYFADEGSDYRLTSTGLSNTANAKAAAQNLMFALANGGAVGVYNAGFHDSGYRNDVAVNDSSGARLNHVQGNYYTGALCDDQVFGLTNMPGTHAPKVPQLAEMKSKANPTASPQMLARLYPANGNGEIVAWRPQFGSGTPIGRIPCQENTITFCRGILTGAVARSQTSSRGTPVRAAVRHTL